MTIPASVQTLLQTPYPLQPEHIAHYQTYRYIKLRQVLDTTTLAFFNEVITDRVNRMNRESRPLEERNTYGRAFLQLFNLWQEDDLIKALVFSPRLGRIAAELMQTTGVRLYHDQALFKEAGGGITPWHADQYYWPLESDKTITAWIPLQAVPLSMGPLEFSGGSHQIIEGRELDISDDSEALIQQRLRVTDFTHVIEPFDAGEISLHSGWVFHRAGANTSSEMRKVMTIIYMDKKMMLKAPENPNQANDWHTWCPGAVPGEVIDTPLNPIIW
jgi:ectoine hydroxylase-related dioxygenase (phytanoyl-CoA dioxygenase family)